MNRTFFDMFGNLTDKKMSDEDLNNLQIIRPDIFSGYTKNALAENSNHRIYRPGKIGYEGIFNEVANVFSPEDPMAFASWFYNNYRNMDPGGLAKFYRYVQTINAAKDLEKQQKK